MVIPCFVADSKMSEGPKKMYLWVMPRSLSTTMLRAFMSRTDTHVSTAGGRSVCVCVMCACRQSSFLDNHVGMKFLPLCMSPQSLSPPYAVFRRAVGVLLLHEQRQDQRPLQPRGRARPPRRQLRRHEGAARGRLLRCGLRVLRRVPEPLLGTHT